MREVEHDIYDDLAEISFVREVLTPAGFEAFCARYAGEELYVNSKFDPRQFETVLSATDAQALAEAFAGDTIYVPTRRHNARLLIALLYMRGFTSVEVAKACKCTTVWVLAACSRLASNYPNLTALIESRNLRKSDLKAPPNGKRWMADYRATRYPEFVAQVKVTPDLMKVWDVTFDRAELLARQMPMAAGKECNLYQGKPQSILESA